LWYQEEAADDSEAFSNTGVYVLQSAPSLVVFQKLALPCKSCHESDASSRVILYKIYPFVRHLLLLLQEMNSLAQGGLLQVFCHHI
jgi:ABC-type proline/glycine betaine transport system permease subunit